MAGNQVSLPRPAADFTDFLTPAGVERQELDTWLRSLRIAPISAVEWTWPAGWKVGPRVINDSMWFWFRTVDAVATIDGFRGSIRLRDGDLLLIPAGARHVIRHAGTSTASTIAVHFDARVFGSISVLELLRFPAQIPAAVGEDFLPPICEKLAHEFAVKAPGWAPMMENLILQAVTGILRNGAGLFDTWRYSGSARDIPRLMPAFRLIEERFADPELSIGEIASAVFLGQVRFRKVFRQATGYSPVHFLRRLRISRVCSELVTSDESVENIAQRCGFSDSRLMRKVFMELVGTAPRDYRRSARLVGPAGPFG